MENKKTKDDKYLESVIEEVTQATTEAEQKIKSSLESGEGYPILEESKRLLSHGLYELENDLDIKIFRKATNSMIFAVNAIGTEMRISGEMDLMTLIGTDAYENGYTKIKSGVLLQAAKNLNLDAASLEMEEQEFMDNFKGKFEYGFFKFMDVYRRRAAQVLSDNATIEDNDIYNEGVFYFRDNDEWVSNRVTYPLHNHQFGKIRINKFSKIFANRSNMPRNKDLGDVAMTAKSPPAEVMQSVEKFIIGNPRLNCLASYNGRLLAGMMISSVFSGYHRNPSQRTQMIMTGGASEGKSWITRLMGACLGKMHETGRGTDSEARLRPTCEQAKLFIIDDGNAGSNNGGSGIQPNQRADLTKACFDNEAIGRRDMEAGTRAMIYWPMRSTILWVGTAINFGVQSAESLSRVLEFKIRRQENDDPNNEFKYGLSAAIDECKKHSDEFVNWTISQAEAWRVALEKVNKYTSLNNTMRINERKVAAFSTAMAGYIVFTQKTYDEMQDEVAAIFTEFMEYESEHSGMAKGYDKIMHTPIELFNTTTRENDTKSVSKKRVITLADIQNAVIFSDDESSNDAQLAVYNALKDKGIFITRGLTQEGREYDKTLYLKASGAAADILKKSVESDETTFGAFLKEGGWSDYTPTKKRGKIKNYNTDMKQSDNYSAGWFIEMKDIPKPAAEVDKGADDGFGEEECPF